MPLPKPHAHYHPDELSEPEPVHKFTEQNPLLEILDAGFKSSVVGFLGGIAEEWYYGRQGNHLRRAGKYAMVFGSLGAGLMATAMGIARIRGVDDEFNVPLTGALLGVAMGARTEYGAKYFHGHKIEYKRDPTFFKYGIPDPWRRIHGDLETANASTAVAVTDGSQS